MRFVNERRHARALVALVSWLTLQAATPDTTRAAESPSAKARGATGPAPQAGKRPATNAYALEALIGLAQARYPGVAAAQHELDSMRFKQFQARWAWIPRGTVKGLFAPTPEIRCGVPPWLDDTDQATRAERERFCVNTDVRDLSLNFNGVFGRIELELAMPLYTFDKLGAARRAAQAGVEGRRIAVEAARQDVALNVTKAYWGFKLADEMLFTIREGKKHVDSARARLEEQLDEGEGDATVSDLLRLKTAAAEVDARLLEADRLARIALDTLALLTGVSSERLRVDTTPIEPMNRPLADFARYERTTRRARPELRMLEAAIKAKRAEVALEKARLLPDFLLVGRLGVGRATNIDDPYNAFLADPFNFVSSGLGLALNWNLNTVEQYGRYREASAGARKTEAQRREAMVGIEIALRKKYLELQEARERLKVTQKGAKAARSWLAATSQNLAAGLAETKELTDALVAYFQLRLRYLQAIFDVNVGWSELARTMGFPIRALFSAQRTDR